VTPQLQKAIELAERQRFLELASKTGRIKTDLTNKAAAKGTLRTGGYLASLMSHQLQAMRETAEALADDCVRLVQKAGPISVEDERWLKKRIAGFLGGRGFLDSIREQSRFVRLRSLASLEEDAERQLDATRSRAVLYLERAIAEANIAPPDAERAVSDAETAMATDPRRVAVIYGRNDKARDAVFDFLRALDLAPIEWEDAVRDTRKGAPYNREVVEKLFENTQAVIVLLTGDEEVVLRPGLRRAKADEEPRRHARANVFFEAGMAFVAHPDRTIIVEIGRHDKVSDFDGMNVVRFDGEAKSRLNLKGRLETAQCAVKSSGDDWLTAGQGELREALRL
jgi:predicted nucleotide-binding protein